MAGSSWLQDLPANIRHAAINLGSSGGDVVWEEDQG